MLTPQKLNFFMKTNILFVSTNLNGGGAEKNALNVLKELEQKEYDKLNHKFLFLNTIGDYYLDKSFRYKKLNTFKYDNSAFNKTIIIDNCNILLFNNLL